MALIAVPNLVESALVGPTYGYVCSLMSIRALGGHLDVAQPHTTTCCDRRPRRYLRYSVLGWSFWVQIWSVNCRSTSICPENFVGIIMSMHLYYAPLTSPSTSKAQRELRLLCGYEDGGVVLRRRTTPQDKQTVEGKGWDVIWKSRLHVESGSSPNTNVISTFFTNPRRLVMAMAVSKDCSFALTVSTDHIVGRYDLVRHRASGSRRSLDHISSQEYADAG